MPIGNQTDGRERETRTNGKEITKKESLHVDMFASEAITNTFSKPPVVVYRECCARHVSHVGDSANTSRVMTGSGPQPQTHAAKIKIQNIAPPIHANTPLQTLSTFSQCSIWLT